ncbi:MAG: hypothetical protein FWC10_10535 [Lentimicrobiaceae bacterium]|nr:hypothetical protein [Lentimicrobiaceae bacterium]MCL2247522.1 hypothetical protein [Lentimicrobiaceae bacterium]
MKNLLKLAVFLLIFSGVASTCNPEPDKEYPQNISFTEYSLAETSCQWVNLPYDDKVLMINSNEELENYISCAEDSYPKIDFSKHTLLLASGICKSGISNSVAEKLKQLELKHYELEIALIPNMLAVETPWKVTIIIDKIDANSMIDLKTYFKNM